jgi:dephospho-CoA kinase
MKLVGLGGGIGAGKSTVSELLTKHGAVIVDADKIAREVVEPRGPAYGPLVERFGELVFNQDGTLDRAGLAAIVFSDAEALRDLNAITHPAIGKVIAERIAEHSESERTVILDAALLFDTPRVGMVGKILVDVDPEIAVDRLVRFRGFSEDDARRRIANQMSRDERRAQADFVIDNSGDREDLVAEVNRAWVWVGSLPNSPSSV